MHQEHLFVLEDSTHIAAPLERVFQLSCSLAIVERELGMRPVATPDTTRTSGLATAGDRIRWEGWQLGFWNYHVSLISAYRPCEFFQDTMLAGRFRFFQHDHRFTAAGAEVLLKDTVRFSLPWGWAGQLVGKYILAPHIAALMRRRFALLKRIAESDEWRAYLPHAA